MPCFLRSRSRVRSFAIKMMSGRAHVIVVENGVHISDEFPQTVLLNVPLQNVAQFPVGKRMLIRRTRTHDNLSMHQFQANPRRVFPEL